MTPRIVHVELGARSYDVVIGAGLMDELGERVRGVMGRSPKRAFVVADEGLPAGVADRARRSLAAASFACSLATLAPSEERKSLGTLATFVERLAASNHERHEPVIALGGGIVGDVAGFAAATYRRGVPFVQVPTTLLAMVDASVGGKTGVNLLVRDGQGKASLRKNYIGAFHQPRLVLADVDVLRSLAEREYRAGIAECLKHGLIAGDLGDAALFDWTLARREAILARDAGTLVELVARNVAIKAKVVSADESETAPDEVGGRALLNLGHTFGHAIETLANLSPDADPSHAPLRHGEAVGLGLCAAARCAVAAGLAAPALHERVVASVASFGLPTRVVGLPASDWVVHLMRADKKTIGDRLRLVLPTEMGRARVVRDVLVAHILAAIDSLRA